MSAAATRALGSEPVIAPTPDVSLRVVPTPAPRRGFLTAVAICLAIIFAALLSGFALNTAMVKTAFEIQQIQQATNAARATEATLEDEILQLSSPAGLAERAEELGLAPAYSVRHVDLEQGTILETENSQGN